MRKVYFCPQIEFLQPDRRSGAHHASMRDLDECKAGAGDETRTRDIFLGKEVLYQLSYTRVSAGGS